MGWQTIIVKFGATAAIGWLVWLLVMRGRSVTIPRFTGAVAAIVLLVLLWLANLERAGHIILLGMEFDQRITLAQDAMKSLAQLEDAARQTADRLDALTARLS